MRFILFVVLCLLTWVAPAAALPPVSTTLTPLTVSANTGEKPQSKVWSHDGRWWCVMPNSSGTWVWRLDGTTWTNVLQLSSATQTHADVKAIGAVTHVLLFNAAGTELASIEYVPATQTYQAWAARPANAPIALDSGTETATIDVDSQGRMWLATDRAAGTDQIVVYHSDTPYATWSGPVTLATGINGDDISLVTAFPDGKIGVLWSNQSTERFGFRTHADGADPAVWTADEVPASQSALNVGLGMADDHMHVAVASDGTLYAAVKTSYDTSGYPKIALLVRRPAGTWDDLYEVDQAGTRGIALLDEGTGTISVIYTSVEGAGNIIYKESPTSSIVFGSSATLMPGGLNDPMSTKANVSGAVVIVAGSGSALNGVLRSSAGYTITASAGPGGTIAPSGAVAVSAGGSQAFTIAASSGYHIADVLVDAVSVGAVANYAFNNVTANHTIAASFAPDVPPADLVGWWRMNGDVTDASSHANHGTAVGGPTYPAGVNGQALHLSGSGQYATVPGNASLDITSQITMAAWFRPTKTAFATQRLLQKGIQSTNNGYELSLSSPGKVFVRFNQQTSGDAIRINSITSYPLNGTAWMHAAATFDGTTIRLYINGVEEGTLTPSPGTLIGTNATALTIGAMGNITNLFEGDLDDVRLYARALSAAEIAALMDHTIDASAGPNGSISPSGVVTVAHGASQAFAMTPDPGYAVASVLVDGVSVGTSADYTFTNVTQSHTIATTFSSLATLTITSSAGPGGTITPSGAVSVSNGGSQAFTIAANAGYHIADVLVDAVSVGAVANYAFNNVTTHHTIAASFAPDPPPADLVGWWRMEGDVTDASTHGNHATAVGGPGFGTGVDGQALNLSGTGQYASVPSNASLDITSQITMAAWFKPTKIGFATQRIIQKGVMNSNNGYELSLSSPGKVFVRFNQQSSADANRINSITSYPLNGTAWMHAAATFDGTTIRLYVNGVEEGALIPSPAITIGTNPTNLTLGAMGDFTNLFQGALDDVRLYDRALGAGEIAALAGVTTYTITATAGPNGSISPSGSVVVGQGANQAFTITADPGYAVADVLVDAVSVGAPTGYTFTNVTENHTIAASFAPAAPPGELVGHWPMEEGGGSAILDASTHLNHGSLPNGATWVAGVEGLALGLDGTSQRATVPDSPSLDFTNAVTLATWVRPGRMTTQNLIKKSTNGGQDGYELSLATAPPAASGRPFVRFNQTSNGNLHRLDGTQLYPFDGNTWVHLAATYDGSTIRLYVDGALDSSKAASLTVAANTLPLGIGGQSDGQFPLLGAMDEVRVYGRALDPGEIQALASHALAITALNGSVAKDPNQTTYLHNAVVLLTATPDPGYQFVGWSGDATGTSNPTSVTMDGNKNVTASFASNPVAPISSLEAFQVKNGNDTDGSIRLRVHWADVIPVGSTVEVYRARFGAYPEYDDGVGAPPIAPPSPPAPGGDWELTSVTASDQTDEVNGAGARDVWYYVAFVRDPFGIYSPGSTPTPGCPNYLLGDVSNGSDLGQGDNVVGGADISALGGSYGLTGAAVDPVNYLDVGPTADALTETRPLTDNAINFEDLVIFALSFGAGGGAQPARAERTASPAAAANVDQLTVKAPLEVAGGEEFTVQLWLEGTGKVRALSAALAWNQAVVEPLGVDAGEWLAQLGGVAFSPGPGVADLALLGASETGFAGAGPVATVRFRAVAAGAPGIGLAGLTARDVSNRAVEVASAVVDVRPQPPIATQLGAAYPNPSWGWATIGFSLVEAGPVTLRIFGVDGRVVRTLASGRWEAGFHRLVWDGRDDQGHAAAAGIYFAQLNATQGQFTKRISYLK